MMLKLIVLATFLANLNGAISVPTSSEESSAYQNDLSASTEFSSSSYTSFSSSSSKTSNMSYNDNYYQCAGENEETEQPTTMPEQTNTTTPTTNPSSNALQKFDKGNSKFTANFFYNVVKENPGKSVIMSPYSTLFLLAALALRAMGESAEQILNVLNLNKNEIQTAIPSILDSIDEQKNVNISLVARVYGNIKSDFSDIFKSETKQILRAEAESIDFSDAQKAADIINKWVAEKTYNKIQDLIPAYLLTSDTELVLTNAFYFLCEWTNKFDPDFTSLKDFYGPENNTSKVNTMYQVDFFNYAEIDNLNAQAIELPYVNQNMTCLIILPKNKDGVTTLLSKLLDEDALTTIKSSLQFSNVAVSLPKFNTTTTIDLKDIFQKLNITAIFDPAKSNLNDILADPRSLFVSSGIQKATIDLNEFGTEAAAGSAAVGKGSGGMPPPPIPFNANHSFVYYLLFRGLPIYCGVFAGK